MPMAGQTIHNSPTKFHPNYDTYGAAMGVLPEDFAPVFHFRKRFGNIDWRKLATIDVAKVARELDFVTLQENISTVAFCNIDAVGELDPLFTKLFKLSQFTIEYLLHSQEYLQSVIQGLESKLEEQNDELEKNQKIEAECKAEILKLRQENKRRRKMIEQQQMLIESGASSYYKCPHCEKAFMNASFLQGHMQRRHPGSVNYIGDVIAHSQLEQSRLAGKLQDLDSDLQKERNIFNSKLRKAEEEKTAWATKSKRDMDKWKREEEAKWRQELEEMKKSFLNEISQLNSREDDHKKTIMGLQRTVDDRQSNLGDLMDGIESDRERTKAYDAKIQLLENENYSKQEKLDKLERQLQRLNSDNKEALKRQQSLLKNDYASMIKNLHQRVDKIPSRDRIEAVPAASEPDIVDSRMASFRRKKADIKDQVKEPLLRMLDEKLQQCGIDPNATGISTQILTNKLMVLKKERQQKAKEHKDFFIIRSDLRSKIDQECRKRGGASSFPRKQKYPQTKKRTNTIPRTSTPGQAPKSSTLPTTGRSSTSYYATTARSEKPSRPHALTASTKQKKVKDDEHFQREDLEADSPWESDISEIDTPLQKKGSTSKTYEKTPHPSKKLPKPSFPLSDEEDSNLDDILMSDEEPQQLKQTSKPDAVDVKQLAAYLDSRITDRTTKKPPPGAVDILPTNVQKLDEDEDSFAVSSLEESPKPAPRQAHSMSSNTYGTSKWGSGQPGTKAAGETIKDLDIADISDWDEDI